jgi:chromosome segregation ATPase
MKLNMFSLLIILLLTACDNGPLKELQTQINALETQVSIVSTQRDDLKKQLEDLQNQLENLKAERDEFKKQLDAAVLENTLRETQKALEDSASGTQQTTSTELDEAQQAVEDALQNQSPPDDETP